jgi:hypothetical protein
MRYHKDGLMEPKTTNISNDKHQPLVVEWLEFQSMRKVAISLVLPETIYREQVRLANMSPQTALNLRDWLIAESPALEALVRDD